MVKLVIAAVTLCIGSAFLCLDAQANGFDGSLSEHDRAAFRRGTEQMSIGELRTLLDNTVGVERKLLVVDALKARGGEASAAALEDVVTKLAARLQALGGRDFESGMVHAAALVALGEVEAAGDQVDLAAWLDRLLSEGDAYVIDAASVECSRIGGSLARDTLKRHEGPGAMPRIRMERLRIDYWHLDTPDFVRSVLKEAWDALGATREHGEDANLSAELSILAERARGERLSEVFEAEAKQATAGRTDMPERETYEGFLRNCRELVQRLEHLEGAQVPTDVQGRTSSLEHAGGRSGSTPPGASQEGAQSPPQEQLAPILRGHSRPEEEGESYRDRPTGVLVNLLSDSTDWVTQRKAAQVLGDRKIANELQLSDGEEGIVAVAVRRYLKPCNADDANVRSEGRLQIQRLWRLAVPALLQSLGSDESCVAETAARSLSLMQEESVVRAIVETAKGRDDDRVLSMAILGLKGMQYTQTTAVPGRSCLDEQAAKAFYEATVVPALRDLERDKR